MAPRRGSRNLVEIPPHVMQQLMSMSKTPGALAQLSRKSGLPDTYLYRTGHGEGTHMNRDYLDRVQRALEGQESTPTEALLRQSRGKTKRVKKSRALVKHGRKAVEAIPEVHAMPHIPAPLMNGREAGLRGLFDGLALGVQIARRTMHEYLDAGHVNTPLDLENGNGHRKRGG